ncbi:MAG: glycosyltransferase family 4 protein [Wenzhouxiangellaceae bacterium]
MLVLITLASTSLTPLMLAYARHFQLHDQPGPRRSHQGVIARGGGAVAVLLLLGGILLWQGRFGWSGLLLPPVLAVALIGWLDDHKPQPIKRRLAVQAGATLWLLALASHPPAINLGPWPLPLSGVTLVWLIPLALLLIPGLINSYNFMDGSHGLAATQAIFSGGACCLLLRDQSPTAAALGGLLAAAMLGFLPWNFPRPRIFMGDVCSGVLGLTIAACMLLAMPRHWLLPLTLSSLFVVDTGMTLIWRMRRGEVWYRAHREHLYQRLIQSGWSHQRVCLTYLLINLILVLPVAAGSVFMPSLALPLFISLSLILALGWLWATRLLQQTPPARGSTA